MPLVGNASEYEDIAVLGASRGTQRGLTTHTPHPSQTRALLGPGAGALATVSLVQHRGNQRYLALKRMDKKKILKMKQLEHIHNEKSLLEEVDHPFIVGL